MAKAATTPQAGGLEELTQALEGVHSAVELYSQRLAARSEADQAVAAATAARDAAQDEVNLAYAAVKAGTEKLNKVIGTIVEPRPEPLAAAAT